MDGNSREVYPVPEGPVVSIPLPGARFRAEEDIGSNYFAILLCNCKCDRQGVFAECAAGLRRIAHNIGKVDDPRSRLTDLTGRVVGSVVRQVHRNVPCRLPTCHCLGQGFLENALFGAVLMEEELDSIVAPAVVRGCLLCNRRRTEEHYQRDERLLHRLSPEMARKVVPMNSAGEMPSDPDVLTPIGAPATEGG